MTAIDALVLLLKASVLLGGALLLSAHIRSGSAVGRHRAWSALFASLVALPLLALTIPTIEVRVPAWRQAPPTPIARSDARDARVAPMSEGDLPSRTVRRDPPVAISPAFVASGRRLSMSIVAPVVWLGGACVAFGALLISLVRVARLTATGTVIEDAAWRESRARISRRLGLTRAPRIIASRSVSTPMAGGVIRPTVFVPLDAPTWSAERRDVVLAHEIAHLASRDPLRHLLCRIAFSIYWFHPLVWVAVRNAMNACEQACDELVLALGIRPSTYARVLLDFAAASPPVPTVALPIVRAAFLETRLMAILNSHRPSIGTGGVIPGAVVVALTLSIAAVRPSPAARVGASTAPTSMVASLRALPPAAKAKTAQPVVTLPRNNPSAPMVIVENTAPVEATCRLDATNSRYFNGTISSSGNTIYQQIGTRDDDHIIQWSFGDLRVCAVAEGHGRDRDDPPSHWSSHATRVILETQQPGDVRRMEIVDNRTTFTVNGRSQIVDPAASAWRDRLLDLLDATWDLSLLKGQVSTLRGEISTTYGERSTLQGEISTLRGRVSTLRGEISTARGEESTLRGEISTIRGQVSTLRGQISTEQGQISSLRSTRSDRYVDRDGIDASIRKHEARIQDIEDEIRRFDADKRVADVQRRMDALDTEGRVQAIERRLRDFDVEARVAEVNKRLAGLDVEGRVEGINREIVALDADNRGVILLARRDEALARLKALLGR